MDPEQQSSNDQCIQPTGDMSAGSGGGADTSAGGSGSSSVSSSESSAGGPAPGNDSPVLATVDNKVSNEANDAIGMGLAACGMSSGPIGAACGVLGELQNETIAAPDKADASYQDDKTMQSINRAEFGASATGTVLGMLGEAGAAEAIGSVMGPLGLVTAAGTALGHGAQALGQGMIEGGIDNNPGQFGDDPMNSIP